MTKANSRRASPAAIVLIGLASWAFAPAPVPAQVESSAESAGQAAAAEESAAAHGESGAFEAKDRPLDMLIGIVMLVLLFAMKLDWAPVTGWGSLRDLILPAITLALPFAARVARLTRAGMLEVVHQDYIRTARAKGLSERAIVMRHTLKGALIPVVSFLGPAVAQMLTGSLVVEMIFGVPGIGKEFVNSAINRDYTLVLGLVLLFGSLLIFFTLLVDILYAFLDPRIRHG